jgi:hypothetical protein
MLSGTKSGCAAADTVIACECAASLDVLLCDRTELLST